MKQQNIMKMKVSTVYETMWLKLLYFISYYMWAHIKNIYLFLRLVQSLINKLLWNLGFTSKKVHTMKYVQYTIQQNTT